MHRGPCASTTGCCSTRLARARARRCRSWAAAARGGSCIFPAIRAAWPVMRASWSGTTDSDWSRRASWTCFRIPPTWRPWRSSSADEMPVEIERKFLVDGDAWRSGVRRRVLYRQGYLAGSEVCSVRVRVGGDEAWLGLKGRVVGATRREYEYPIPLHEANEILDELCA